MSKRSSTFLSVIVCVALSGAAASAAVTTIDFDSFAPAIYPTNFLAAEGIPNMTIGGTGPNAAGPRVFAAVFPMIPGSSPNVFFQHATANDSGQTHSLTMTFSPELTAFSLNRIGVTLGSSSSTPQWSATFFDSSGGTLGSFGEAPWQFQPPLQSFSFTAPSGQTIASMRLESIWTSSTWRNIPVDDFVLTQVDEVPASSPESTVVIAAVLGSLMLLFLLRRVARTET